MVQAYLIHIADRSDANFRRILELKGIRSKQEQSSLIELFQIHRASDRYAPNLQQSNPLVAQLQSSTSSTATPTASGSQGLGLSNLSGAGVPSLGASTLQSRFDASTLGSALISAARDGVDRLGTPALGTLGSAGAALTAGVSAGGMATGSAPQSGSGTPTLGLGTAPGQRGNGIEATTSTTTITATNLNENLKSIGKFFRRDLGGFSGRFGRGDDGSGR
jgi:hypothetical protein